MVCLVELLPTSQYLRTQYQIAYFHFSRSLHTLTNNKSEMIVYLTDVRLKLKKKAGDAGLAGFMKKCETKQAKLMNNFQDMSAALVLACPNSLNRWFSKYLLANLCLGNGKNVRTKIFKIPKSIFCFRRINRLSPPISFVNSILTQARSFGNFQFCTNKCQARGHMFCEQKLIA